MPGASKKEDDETVPWRGLVTGSTSLVLGIVLFLIGTHFAYVVVDEYFQRTNVQEWEAASYRITTGICGFNDTILDKHEFQAQNVELCRQTRRMVSNWGYLKLVLDKTWDEHYGHVRSWLNWPLYMIAACGVRYVLNDPTAFGATIFFWLGLLYKLIVSCGLNRICRARKVQERIRRNKDQQYSSSFVHRCPTAAYHLASPMSSEAPNLVVEGNCGVNQSEARLLTYLLQQQALKQLGSPVD